MTDDPNAAGANPHPELPLGDLRGAAPDVARLGEHAERVRAFAAIAGPFERWWLDPRVQAFVAELSATGI